MARHLQSIKSILFSRFHNLRDSFQSTFIQYKMIIQFKSVCFMFLKVSVEKIFERVEDKSMINLIWSSVY